MVRVALELLGGKVFGIDDELIKEVTKEVAYTKEEIDSKLTAVLKFRGTKATKAELPLTNLTRGDVWAVTEDNLEFVWLKDRNYATSVDEWEQLGPIHDLSAYYTKTEINNMLGTIPEGRTIMDLIGSNIPAGKSLKQLIDDLQSEVDALEVRVEEDEAAAVHTNKKVAEAIRRIGDGEFKRPEEETYLEDKLYYSRNEDGEYKQLQWGTDYNFGDPIPENVYDRAAWSNLSQRMANAEGRISSAEEGLQSLDTRVTTNEGNISTLQTNLTATQTRLKDTLYAYNYDFATSKISDPFDAERGEGECKMELLNAALANKAIRVVALNKTDPLGDKPVNFNFVNTKREAQRIIGVPLLGITYYIYFYAQVLSDRLAKLEVKYTWKEPVEGGDPTDIALDSVTVTKFEFSYTAVTSEDAKPTTANKGDICVVKKTLGDDTIQYTGYVWNGSQWSAMDGNYDASSVIMGANITLAGDYTAVGNIKMTDGTLNCKGWTVAKLFKEIFNKTIKPTLGDPPTTSVTFGSAGSKEVGTEVTPSYGLTFSQGKYKQPWDNKTQDDGTTEKSYSCTSSSGETLTTKTGTFAKFTVTDDSEYKVTGKIEYNDGVKAKDNTGAETDIYRPTGWTATKDSSKVTAFRYMYIGSLATDDAITETVIKGLTKFTCGAVTKTLKASGGDIPLVAGAKKVIVAIPVRTAGKTANSACGGYTLNQVLLVSASNTPITSDYKAKPNVSVSGKVAAQNMKDYKVWVYQPASIDPGEIHSIKIA